MSENSNSNNDLESNNNNDLEFESVIIETENKSDIAKDKQGVYGAIKIEQDNNNSIWYIICSLNLKEDIKNKIYAAGITLIPDDGFPVAFPQWQPQDDKNICIKLLTKDLSVQLKDVQYNTNFVIKKEYNWELDISQPDLCIGDVRSEVAKVAKEEKKVLLDHMFADQSAKWLNKDLLQNVQIDKKNVDLLDQRIDFENNQMIFSVKVPWKFNLVTYHFNEKDFNYKEHGKIVLIGNSEEDANNPLFGHLGSLNRYNLQDVMDFATTICETKEIYKILNNEDKQKVKTIYKTAIEIGNIYKTQHIPMNNIEARKEERQAMEDEICKIMDAIDKYDPEESESIRKLNEFSIKYICKFKHYLSLQKVCRRVEKIYQCLGKQKHADVCKTISEYDPGKIDQAINKKTNERNSRWGCIMKKRINEQIDYLDKMKEQPLLYNSKIINEISQRTPDSFTCSPCNFVQPWNKKENLTEVQKDILFGTDVIDRKKKKKNKDANSNENLNNSYHSANIANDVNNCRPNENINNSYRSADSVNYLDIY